LRRKRKKVEWGLGYMEVWTLYLIGISILIFIGVGAYLHLLRKRAEKTVPAPFLNPHGKRKPKKKR
jgi:hypothetical protein